MLRIAGRLGLLVLGAACSSGGPGGGAQDVRDPVQRDVNGDGFIDFVVGAPGTGSTGTDTGRVFVFEDAGVADVVLSGGVAGDRFGRLARLAAIRSGPWRAMAPNARSADDGRKDALRAAVNAVWIGERGVTKERVAPLKAEGARVFAEFNTL